MTELRENITKADRWYRGFHKVFQYTATTREGAVVDLSGFTAFEWGIYEPGAGKDASPLFTAKTLGDGIAVTDGPAGELQVTVEPADTLPLTPNEYEARLSGTDAAGITDVLVQASAVLRQSPSAA